MIFFFWKICIFFYNVWLFLHMNVTGWKPEERLANFYQETTEIQQNTGSRFGFLCYICCTIIIANDVIVLSLMIMGQNLKSQKIRHTSTSDLWHYMESLGSDGLMKHKSNYWKTHTLLIVEWSNSFVKWEAHLHDVIRMLMDHILDVKFKDWFIQFWQIAVRY